MLIGHPRPLEMRGKPVPYAMWCEAILNPMAIGIMQSDIGSMFHRQLLDTIPIQSPPTTLPTKDRLYRSIICENICLSARSLWYQRCNVSPG
jgi:hypothetical protein